MSDFIIDNNYSCYRRSGANSMQALAPVGLIPLSGSVEFTDKVNANLVARRQQYITGNALAAHNEYGLIRQDYRIPAQTVRFSSGEAKGVIKSTVRGHDLYILCDITNYSVTYKLFGHEVPLGPDDYYQDLKRIILATCGRARRINVIMPYLYESRQDIRNSRESLDCAFMLQELFDLGVASILTFDPHEPRVENSVPCKGIEIIPSTYQLIAGFLTNCPDVSFDGEHRLMVISPDENGMKRAMYYASVLEVPLGTFFRQRDYSHLVDGRNPVMSHNYMGENVAGRDILMVSDMMETGNSFIETARQLKEQDARNIYMVSTFGIFAHGLDALDQAYADGVFNKVIITNLSYITPELSSRPWLVSVDMTEFVALIIDALNHDVSIAALLDQTSQIKSLLKLKGEPQKFQEWVEERNGQNG